MSAVKTSYTLPCSSAFRDAVLALAARRRVNAADLARSVMLVVPEKIIDAYPDPGEPAANDRETVVLRSGRAAGRPWRRKPRLQVRLPDGLTVPFVRKALNMALALDDGTVTLRIEDAARDASPADPDATGGTGLKPPPEPAPSAAEETLRAEAARLREELERLHAVIAVLLFAPLPHGVRTQAEALHVLGFPPNTNPGSQELRARFRMLATIHHPDGTFGSHERMSQLNAAMDILRGR